MATESRDPIAAHAETEDRSDPHPCPYLPEQICELLYYDLPDLTPEEYEGLMNRGFRKFGTSVFRTACPSCTACRPLRVDVGEFQPNRSQRRAARDNADLLMRLRSPSVDEPRLRLYNRYHLWREETRGWNERRISWYQYAFSFVMSPFAGIEISMWEGETLQAVVIADVTPNTVSGVYHYYNPDRANRGLGTACMLATINAARLLERRWVYFGFYVAGCGSLEYKGRFQPNELMDEHGVWGPGVEM